MKKLLLQLSLLLLVCSLQGQTGEDHTDSLKRILNTQNLTSDKKIEVLLKIAEQEGTHDVYDAKLYATKALELAEQYDFHDYKAKAYLCLARVSQEEQEYDSSIYYFKKAIHEFDPEMDIPLLAKTNNELGIVFEERGNHPEAYNYYLKSLRLYESIQDQHGIASEYLNVGLINHYRKNYIQADKYFKLALELAKKFNYPDIEASAMSNLGMNYQLQKDYIKALEYFKHVLEMDMKSGDQRDIAYSLNNLGSIYSDNHQYADALAYFLKSAAIKERLKDDAGLTNSFNNIANAYIHLDHLKEAEEYLLKSEQLSKKTGITSNLIETYQGFYELYNLRKDYKTALNYFIKYNSAKDSFFLQEKDLAIDQLQKQFELDKANKEIEVKNMQLENERRVMFYFIILLVALLILCIYFIYSIRRINKLNDTLESHQQEIEIQNESLKQKNIEVMKARIRAEEAAKAKGQFLSVMSHEIRTPLNAIIGITNLLNELTVDELQRKNIQILKASSDNLMALINDILDLSKIESGKMHVEQVEFCLKDVVHNLFELFLINAKEKGLSLQLNYDAALKYKMLGDPLRINQILSNLISNGIKFTEHGKVEIHVMLLNETKDYFDVKFEVTDTGIGIPEDKVETIFDSFEQANKETSRKYGGTGLGLSISKQLLEMLGSHLQLKTTEGIGSAFYFTVRFAKIHPDDLNLDTKDDESLFEQLAGKRILIAEDNPVNVYILKQFLGRWKMNVVLADDGFKTVELAKKSDFDIVLMDINMPVLDGYQAAKQILALKPNLPIVAITANTLDEITDKMKQAGIMDCVPKPFQPTELAQKILTNLSKS